MLVHLHSEQFDGMMLQSFSLESDMYFDRFDIASAYYLALSHCHSGQWSVEYSRLCRMSRYFTPSPLLSVDTLSEKG